MPEAKYKVGELLKYRSSNGWLFKLVITKTHLNYRGKNKVGYTIMPIGNEGKVWSIFDNKVWGSVLEESLQI
jgi:hypothetical protein